MRLSTLLRASASGVLLCVCAALTDSWPRGRAPATPEEEVVPGQDIELVLTRDTFVAGEPIAVKVRIWNRTARTLWLSCVYPDLELTGGPPKRRWTPAEMDAAFRIGPGGIIFGPDPRDRIDPGSRHESVIHLQTLLSHPGVGAHCISYSAGLEDPAAEDPTIKDSDGRIGSARLTLRGTGRLLFTVRPARPGELEQIAARYAARIGADGTAAEALCLMDARYVIPHLVRLVTHPASGESASFLVFRLVENEEAREVLRKALASADEGGARRILEVLASWRCDVDIALLRKLYRSDDDRLRLAVQRYARRLGKPEYFEFIKGIDDGPA